MPASSAPSPTAKVTLPHQSTRAWCRSPTSCSDLYDHTVPTSAMGTLTQNTARQSHSDSTPPSTSPMNEPAIAATWFTPSASPRWSDGNASVRIAAELANSIAPPTPCTTRQPISHSAPAAAVQRVKRQRDRRDREDDEPEVVDPHPAVDVAEPSERHDEDRRHQQEAHQHPQQVADVAGRQRVQPDPAEDRGQRDQDDRGVDGRQEHPDGRVGQGHPLVVRVIDVVPAHGSVFGMGSE